MEFPGGRDAAAFGKTVLSGGNACGTPEETVEGDEVFEPALLGDFRNADIAAGKQVLGQFKPPVVDIPGGSLTRIAPEQPVDGHP